VSLGSWAVESGFDIAPDHPVLIKILRAVPCVETTCRDVVWIDIHAHPLRFAFHEPCSQSAEQGGRNSTAAAAGNYVDPLQLSVASTAPSQVSSNKADANVVF